MLLATLSTLISSIALIGVAVSLLLQARQLRSGQVQSTADSQRELMKFALEYPAIVGQLAGAKNLDDFTKQIALNWHMSHLETCYLNNTVAEKQLRRLVALIFSNEFARAWWKAYGISYDDSATSRRERDFFAIVNAEFKRSVLASEPATTGARLAEESPEPSPPAS